MNVFSSSRERRLWAFAIGVILTIYATIPFAGRLADMLRGHGLLEISFSVGVFLIGLAVLVHALASRASVASFAIGLGIFAVYLLVFVRIANPAERTHLIEYGVVALISLEALRERARHRRVAPPPPVLAILFASVTGAADEAVQIALPDRVFDARDVFFNTLASVMAVSSSVALSWARRRKSP